MPIYFHFIFCLIFTILHSSEENKGSLYMQYRINVVNRIFLKKEIITPPHNIPIFEIAFNDGTKHFNSLRQLILDGRIEEYNQLNKRKKEILNFNGQQFEAKIKAHGKEPSGHASGDFISLNIKLINNSKIYGLSHFRLIVFSRLIYSVKEIEFIGKKLGIKRGASNL